MKESEFFAKLLATFRIEAEEHLKALSNGLLSLEGGLPQEEQKKVVEHIFREAHSLKGASRSVNQNAIERTCQALETILAKWKKEAPELSREIFDTIYAAIDFIEKALQSSVEQAELNAIVGRLESIMQEKKDLPKEEPKKETEEAALPKEKEPEEAPVQKEVEHKNLPKDTKSIRIPLSKLNHLFEEIEELLMVKLVAQSQVDLLKKFQRKKGNYEKDLGKLIKISEQNTHFVESMVDGLLEDMKKILMQPISTLFDSLPSMIRSLAKDLGKEVKIEFQGGEIEVDRRILEEIKDPVIHIIRNALDHGIESKEERLSHQKPAYGFLRFIAREGSGNSVELSISDDGKGMNREAIKQTALKQGLLSQKEADQISDEDILKITFQSGFSTRTEVTDLSGRGIGLGVVADKVDTLGGRLHLSSVPSEGTTFKIILPSTLATFRGIHIDVGGRQFIIPTHNIKRVIRLKKDEIRSVGGSLSIQMEDHSLPYVHLGELLGLQSREGEQKSPHQFIVVATSLEKMAAFGIDGIHREQEILVKSLGKQGARVKNMMAATVMEEGSIIPILNPSDLIQQMGSRGGVNRVAIEEKTEEKKQMILLVEDSLTTRLLFKNILESAGYQVQAAVDGLEAWELLQEKRFDLIMTDVEMPRMNGFVLMEKIQTLPGAEEIPIVVCTSLGSQEDREKGMELGASAYIDKSSFQQADLISLLKKLI